MHSVKSSPISLERKSMTAIRTISHSYCPYFYRTRIPYEYWADDADLSLMNLKTDND